MYTLSVIIPVYNKEKYISQAIDSVLNQPMKEIEIILVNDGSTDSSLKECEIYAKKYSNIQLVSQDNQGASVARNVGISLATGEYIQFLDADDYYISGALSESLQEILRKKQVDVYIFSSYRANSKRNRFCYDLRYSNQLIPGHYLHPAAGTFASCIIKRSLLEEHQILFDEGIRLNEDKVFKMKVLYMADIIQTTEDFCYVYCNTKKSIMHHTSLYEHDRVDAWKCAYKWFERNLSGMEKENVLFAIQIMINSRLLQFSQKYIEGGHSKKELLDELKRRGELEILQNLKANEVFSNQINDLITFQTNIDKFVRNVQLNRLIIFIGKIILYFPFLRRIRENKRYPIKDVNKKK